MLTAFGDVKPPCSDRSVSDSIASSHDSLLMPLSSSSSRHSYDWSSSIASSDSPHDSDQAIDSDILSVLADCDSSDMGDAASMEFAANGPPSSSSYHSHTSYGGGGDSEDQDMLSPGMECFDIAEHVPTTTIATGGLRINDLFRRAELENNPKNGVDLNSFEVKSNEWSGGRVDAMYLSTHMEKMSMVHATHDSEGNSLGQLTGASVHLQHHPQGSGGGEESPPLDSLPSMSNLEQFPSVAIESFAVKEMDELVPESMELCETGKGSFVGLENHSSNWTTKGSTLSTDHSVAVSPGASAAASSHTSTATKTDPQLLWMKEFPASSCLTALETQHQYVDDVFQETLAAAASRAPHEWKTQKVSGSPRFNYGVRVCQW